MRKTLLLAASAAFACTAAHSAAADATLVQLLESRFRQDRTGACVVAALIDGEHVERQRYCAQPRADGGPGFDAAFEIGSVTKTMTAFLVADLIEKGRWSLDDPIAKHLPAGTVVPAQGERQILVRDLLTHTSGLPALPSRMRPTNPADPYANLSEADLLGSLADVKLTRPIGSLPSYSNFGMMVVSLAVARSYGADYEAVLRQHLFQPLKMDGAFVSRPADGEVVAQGHLPSGAATAAWTISPNLAGVGMVHARLDDMVRYAQAELGQAEPGIVQRTQMTQRPLTHDFGMNWSLAEIKGHALVMHEGGTGGFSSLVALEPAHHRGVVLLADAALSDLGGLSDVGLAALGIETPVQKPRLALSAPQPLRQAMQGQFELGSMPLRIWQESPAEGGRLMAQAQGQGAFELLYDSHDDFYPTFFSALLTPIPGGDRDGTAPVDRFAWRQGGGLVEGRRKGARLEETPIAQANPAWRDWLGEYGLLPQFSLRVFEQGGHLMLQGTAQAAIPAEVTGTDRIEAKVVGVVLEFKRNASGEVVRAQLTQHGHVLEGDKKPAPPASS